VGKRLAGEFERAVRIQEEEAKNTDVTMMSQVSQRETISLQKYQGQKKVPKKQLHKSNHS